MSATSLAPATPEGRIRLLAIWLVFILSLVGDEKLFLINELVRLSDLESDLDPHRDPDLDSRRSWIHFETEPDRSEPTGLGGGLPVGLPKAKSGLRFTRERDVDRFLYPDCELGRANGDSRDSGEYEQTLVCRKL